MPLDDELRSAVAAIAANQWEVRQGQVVPEPADLRLGNDAVEFDRATVLYADLHGSTAMVEAHGWQLSAEVYKTFLHCAAAIIRAEGGAITSYDGDRVMGIWIGARQTTPAAIAALKINYAVREIVNPALWRQYPTWDGEVRHVVGIDTSKLRAARTGVRGGNDIVWVGRAANFAAKLTEIDSVHTTWLTQSAYERLLPEAELGGNPPASMWTPCFWTEHDNTIIHGSNWQHGV